MTESTARPRDGRRAGWLAIAVSTVTLAAGLVVVAPPTAAHAQVGADPVPAVEAVPEADCGPGSRPETGLQGQVPREDRDSGRSREGYQCNLEVVGTHQHGEGASWQFAWHDDCAYYGTLDNPSRVTDNGAVVVDASDPANPVETALLDTPAVNDPHESLKVHEQRELLAAVQLNGSYFDVYDVGDDCSTPQLQSSVELPGVTGHEGNFSADGQTYYIGDRTSGNNQYCPVDVSDPTQPELIMCWSNPGTTHGMSTNADGSRTYFSLAQGANPERPGAALNGLLIADTSEVQARQPDPEIRIVSELYWTDGAQAQMSQPMTIDGEPYLLFVDELGRGAGRIIDISDETNPTIVSRLKLEVHLPQHTGPEVTDGGAPLFVYDGHYCSVDDPEDSTAVACGYFESGIRVFDIRDPENPREIAYYNPPAIPDEPKPASSHIGDHTADRCAAQVRFVEPTEDPVTDETTPGQLWTQCQDNEFMILEFTNGAWPADDAAPSGDSQSTEPVPTIRRATATAAGVLPLPLLLPLGLGAWSRRRRRAHPPR